MACISSRRAMGLPDRIELSEALTVATSVAVGAGSSDITIPTVGVAHIAPPQFLNTAPLSLRERRSEAPSVVGPIPGLVEKGATSINEPFSWKERSWRRTEISIIAYLLLADGFI